MRNKPSFIVIHCSDSTFGDAATIDRWHVERGWSGIGYHYVILRNGAVEVGRPEDAVGAHCVGYNAKSIGVCLIGRGSYTNAQAEELASLVTALMIRYEIPARRVIGHNEAPSGKTKGCPLLNMDRFRAQLAKRLRTPQDGP